ncbi:Clavaminate synthase-like protein [Cytidiella melzeri]|nr:Clavaminate synthase-like protein [Cytidiella melzeri]
MHEQLKSIQSTVTAEDSFKTFISKRQPVVIKGLPDDESFKARSWTDLNYLAEKAGDSEVLIEPMHPESHQFGTNVQRLTVSFREFLLSLQREEGPHHYLTTQYADLDSDELEQTALPPPADALAGEYPHVPRIMGNVCLQQVNLWLGRSTEGSTSGLHHDFHDNLYCLLRGRKRFVLYPPSEIKNLYPYGTLDALHENGLISYADAPVRSDGLPVRVALKARVKAIEQKLSFIPRGKGKGKQDTKERKALMKAHDEALDELAQYTLEAVDGIDVEDEIDDFDALMADMGGEDSDGLDDEVENTSKINAESEDEEENDEDEDEETGEGGIQNDEAAEGGEPSSFSRVPTAFVHHHLDLPTTAIAPPSASMHDFPLLQKTPPPFVVDLNAGEMLYLPASWWHEVTSSSGTNDDEAIHMAFNYWFYPPDNLDSYEEPYKDTLVWEYFRSKQGHHTRFEGDADIGAPLGKTKRKSADKSKDPEPKRSRR